MYLQVVCLCLLGAMAQAHHHDFERDIHPHSETNYHHHKGKAADHDKVTDHHQKVEKSNKHESPTDADVFYKLKNIENGLYLDSDKAKSPMKLLRATEEDSQLWTIQHIGSGKFLILNKKTGHALDVPCRPGYCFVWTHPKHGKSNQIWYIESDGTIVSDHDKHSNDKLAVTVKSNGNIVAEPIDCEKNQHFAIEPVNASTISSKRMFDLPLHDEINTRFYW